MSWSFYAESVVSSLRALTLLLTLLVMVQLSRLPRTLDNKPLSFFALTQRRRLSEHYLMVPVLCYCFRSHYKPFRVKKSLEKLLVFLVLPSGSNGCVGVVLVMPVSFIPFTIWSTGAVRSSKVSLLLAELRVLLLLLVAVFVVADMVF